MLNTMEESNVLISSKRSSGISSKVKKSASKKRISNTNASSRSLGKKTSSNDDVSKERRDSKGDKRKGMMSFKKMFKSSRRSNNMEPSSTSSTSSSSTEQSDSTNESIIKQKEVVAVAVNGEESFTEEKLHVPPSPRKQMPKQKSVLKKKLRYSGGGDSMRGGGESMRGGDSFRDMYDDLSMDNTDHSESSMSSSSYSMYGEGYYNNIGTNTNNGLKSCLKKKTKLRGCLLESKYSNHSFSGSCRSIAEDEEDYDPFVPKCCRINGKSCFREATAVIFDRVQVREYERVVGDNPSVRDMGAPLAIGWAHTNRQDFTLDQYEDNRADVRRGKKDLFVPSMDRDALLVDWGYSEDEIYKSVMEVGKVRYCRERTIMKLVQKGKICASYLQRGSDDEEEEVVSENQPQKQQPRKRSSDEPREEVVAAVDEKQEKKVQVQEPENKPEDEDSLDDGYVEDVEDNLEEEVQPKKQKGKVQFQEQLQEFDQEPKKQVVGVRGFSSEEFDHIFE